MFPSKNIQTSYVFKISELMLLYCFKERKKKNFIDLMNNYCDIYRKTDLYDIEKKKFFPNKKRVWDEITLKIKNLSKLEKNKFIKQSVKILKPHLLKRIKNKTNLVEYNTYARFGCFTYYIKDKKVDLHMPVFQFINHKILKSKKYNDKQKFSLRAKDLHSLINHVKKKYPKAKVIEMGSWLNKYKPFRTLFPKAWKSTNRFKKKNSLAWWGQFIDVTGKIHKKNVRLFIKNFKFPYPGEFYQCKVSELDKFISYSIK